MLLWSLCCASQPQYRVYMCGTGYASNDASASKDDLVIFTGKKTIPLSNRTENTCFVSACVSACISACVCACARACLSACARACVPVCACQQHAVSCLDEWHHNENMSAGRRKKGELF